MKKLDYLLPEMCGALVAVLIILLAHCTAAHADQGICTTKCHTDSGGHTICVTRCR